MPVEPDDRGLAQHRLDNAGGSDRVVTDRRPGPRPCVLGQDHPLPHSEGRRRLLPSARRAARGRRGSRRRGGDHDHGDRRDVVLLVVVFVLVLVILVIDLDDVGDDLDLDVDLLGIVEISFSLLSRGCVGFVLIGVGGGVGGLCGHTGSCETDG